MTMKKISIGMSVLVISAMALAACAPGAGNNSGSGDQTGSGAPAAEMTQVVPNTGDQGTGLEATQTPGDLMGAADSTPSVEPTLEATTVDDTGVPSDTYGGTTGNSVTDESGSGSQALQEGQFVPLSQFLTWGVQSSDEQAVGQVAGVVVNGSSSASTGGSNTGSTDNSGSTGSSDTGSTGTTGGSDSSTSGSTSSSVNNLAGLDIRYLVVDTRAGVSTSSQTGDASSAYPAGSTGGSDSSASASGQTDANAHYVLVPWAAVDSARMTGSASNGSGATTGSGDTGSTGSGDTTGSTGSGSTGTSGSAGSTSTAMAQDSTVYLTIAAADIQSAPVFAMNNLPDMATSGWDASVAQYWSDKSLSIPNTGESQSNSSNESGNSFVLQAPVQSFDITGQDGTTLGQVSDFLVDVRSGRIVYAVISGGSLPQGSLYAVPMSAFSWSAGVDSAGTTNAPTVSSFTSNFTADRLTSAPSVTSLSDFSGTGWQSGVNQYWNGQ